MKSANRIGAAASAVLLLAAFTAAVLPARADDFGPRGDVREIRFAAQRLLARTARRDKIEPSGIDISDVVVVKNAALLSWNFGAASRAKRGVMGLMRQYDRWWDALDIFGSGECWDEAFTAYPLRGGLWQNEGLEPASGSLLSYGLPLDLVTEAQLHNSDVRTHAAPLPIASGTLVKPRCLDAYYRLPAAAPIVRAGGSLDSFRSDTAGYQIAIRYPANDASGAVFHVPYARAPTQAEIIPYPTTYHFLSNAVMYFDLTIDGTKPVTFAPGTTIDIWFPFVLDDTLRYDLTIGFANEPIGPIYSRPFDNTLHYVLPALTITPGRTLMAEIDGNWP